MLYNTSSNKKSSSQGGAPVSQTWNVKICTKGALYKKDGNVENGALTPKLLSAKGEK